MYFSGIHPEYKKENVDYQYDLLKNIDTENSVLEEED